nr:MAG TPA: hypothetical protein [Caudoviricetes sp.]
MSRVNSTCLPVSLQLIGKDEVPSSNLGSSSKAKARNR